MLSRALTLRGGGGQSRVTRGGGDGRRGGVHGAPPYRPRVALYAHSKKKYSPADISPENYSYRHKSYVSSFVINCSVTYEKKSKRSRE